MCCSANVSVCFMCCVFDSVCELFGETILNVFGCGCYFVVECGPLLRPCSRFSGWHGVVLKFCCSLF